MTPKSQSCHDTFMQPEQKSLRIELQINHFDHKSKRRSVSCEDFPFITSMDIDTFYLDYPLMYSTYILKPIREEATHHTQREG